MPKTNKTVYLTGDKVGVKKMTAYLKRHHPNIKVLMRPRG
jgi:UDP-N-acetyl-D-mannosaminuronic acid transferase (WecB/TagA/CpsF family)